MDIAELLASSSLFSHLSPAAIYRLADLTQLHSFRASEVIINQGEVGVGCFIIASGKVEVVKDLHSNTPVILAELAAGEIIGEMSVIDSQPHSASVRALEDTQCLMIERWDFKAQMQAYPEIALQLLPVLAQRLRRLIEGHSA